jgi:hypothetical protein
MYEHGLTWKWLARAGDPESGTDGEDRDHHHRGDSWYEA